MVSLRELPTTKIHGVPITMKITKLVRVIRTRSSKPRRQLIVGSQLVQPRPIKHIKVLERRRFT
jgi:hypothetical protein